ncbi:MAG: hypothetical protein M1816_003696 [Peltula sp. TS41687]|nr:MAG: hypothetical protein M1816_003696 [Peltula sp. TS41687]
MARPANETVQDAQSASLECASALLVLAQENPNSAPAEQRHVTTILNLLSTVAAKRTSTSLHHPEEQISGALLLPEPAAQPDVPTLASGPPAESDSQNNRASVISKIEVVLQGFADAIIEDRELAVVLSARRRPSSDPQICPEHEDANQPEAAGATVGPSREIRFPGSTSQEAWTFTVVQRILGFIHEALVNNLVITKRDIYYKDPGLFVKQCVVDRFVDDIACTFGITRGCLNVVAAAKGLVLGPLKITRHNGSVLDCAVDEDGTLIPHIKEIQNVDLSEVRWILVIEKEGKGYPDIATRYLLRLLSTHPSLLEHQRPPLYGLVDFDPDGIAIMSTYKHGSLALAHENARLRVPGLKRLGIRSKDIMMFDSVDDDSGLLRLTARDRRKARHLLGDKELDEEGQEIEWRRDLQYMLMLNVKAEIQILSNLEGGLERWLEREITAQYLAGA